MRLGKGLGWKSVRKALEPVDARHVRNWERLFPRMGSSQTAIILIGFGMLGYMYIGHEVLLDDR